MSTSSIIFVGGGTAGHIAPLLPVMQAVHKQAPAIDLVYVGLKSDLESPLLKKSELPLEKRSISAGKLNRFMTWKHLSQAGRVVQGMVQAEQILASVKPKAVMAKGGFVSLPIVLAAVRRGIPVFCHETDVIPGLANRIIGRYARTIFTAFPEKYYHSLPTSKLKAVGQPVRPEFYVRYERSKLRLVDQLVPTDLPLMTVIGGSQGAHRVNTLVRGAWDSLLVQARIVHICGITEYESLLELAQQLPEERRQRLMLLPFIDKELPAVFQASQLIISRAGGTIAEIAACHKPVILLPLSTAAQNHQAANAEVLKKAGAAIVLDETTVSSDQLAATAVTLLTSPEERGRLEQAVAQFDHPDAAEKIAEVLLAPVHGSPS